MSDVNRTYGCCSNIPEAFLHTGESQDYPQWYINYLKGVGGRNLPTPAKKLLFYLSDKEWCRKIQCSVVGRMSLEACLELGLVESRVFEKNEEEGWLKSEFKITPKGRDALEKLSLL